MEFLRPDGLGDALEMRAARPDALPLMGGTDVMVELNFDRRRPGALLDLTRVEELATWQHADGMVRLRTDGSTGPDGRYPTAGITSSQLRRGRSCPRCPIRVAAWRPAGRCRAAYAC